jgi:hypothetical protein
VPGVSDSATDSASALAFELFDDSADSFALAVSPVGTPSAVSIAQGIARQKSSILPGSISASGEASGALTLTASVGSSASAEGESLLDLTFTVGVPSSYTLAGFLNTQAIVTGGASIPTLENDLLFENLDNSTVLFQSLTDDESFSLVGILSPGKYRLTASASVEAEQLSSPNFDQTVYGLSSFEFSLQLKPSTVPDSGGGLVGLAAIALGIFAFWQNRGKQVHS